MAAPARKEGIAIIDVDPKSKSSARSSGHRAPGRSRGAPHLLQPRPVEGLRHGARQGGVARHRHDERTVRCSKVVAVPGCSVGEDVVFSADDKYWYLTCMGTQAVIVGDARTDEPLGSVKVAAPYPHGIAIHDGIDRILLTSTVRATDLGDAGEVISAVEASSGKVLGTSRYRTSRHRPGMRRSRSCSFRAPIRRWPMSPTCTKARCGPPPGIRGRRTSTCSRHTTSRHGDAGVPLEMYFNRKADRMYVTTAKPGHMHIFDLSAGPGKPRTVEIHRHRRGCAPRRVHSGLDAMPTCRTRCSICPA